MVSSMEGVTKSVDSIGSKMDSVQSDMGELKSDVSTNKKDIRTLAGTVRDTLGVVGTLTGEVDSMKKVSFSGSASAGPAAGQAQAAPDTTANRGILSGALKRVNKFLDEQGGST